jgi:hypothetical protein
MNDGLHQLLDFMCCSTTATGSLRVHVAKDPDPEMRFRVSGDTKFEETRIRELRQKAWNVIVEKGWGVSILEGFD